ncbi:MAG: hypothetical protein MJZ51_02860 [Bacteroidales bacterium]|nr:hypothetical protein [Bacteroidales bacterium]
MKRILVLTLILGALAATGCSSRKAAGNSNALLIQYMQDDSQANLVNLSKAYGSQLSRVIREGRPQPGECADYAVTLALLNHAAEANTWFNLEAYYYPTSTQYVEQLKLDLIPEYASDNSTDAKDADLSAFDSKSVEDGSANAQMADNNQQAATKVKLTKKEKKKLARQKAKAKKKAKHEKQKAKKAKIKAKKKAKKQAAKQKAKAQKESNRNEE